MHVFSFRNFSPLVVQIVASYFPLLQCIEGLKVLASSLFGATFHNVPMAPGESWHPDVLKLALHHPEEVKFMDEWKCKILDIINHSNKTHNNLVVNLANSQWCLCMAFFFPVEFNNLNYTWMSLISCNSRLIPCDSMLTKILIFVSSEYITSPSPEMRNFVFAPS